MTVVLSDCVRDLGPLALFLWKKEKKNTDMRGYSCQNVCFLHLIYMLEVVALSNYLKIRYIYSFLLKMELSLSNWPLQFKVAI